MILGTDFQSAKMTSVSLRGEDPPQEGPETAKEVEQEAVGGTVGPDPSVWWGAHDGVFFPTFFYPIPPFF